MTNNVSFRVEKEHFDRVNVCEEALADLQAGQVRLQVNQYALTANNVTYAVLGFSFKYWNFYPTAAPYGIIPVWGYATVVASRHEAIQVGERLYGYYPMARYCTLQPTQVNPYSFIEGSAHRQGLAAVYNSYTRVAADPVLHHEDLQAYVPLVYPLFATAFLIYQFLKSKAFIGAEQVVLTSASSKTALGLAYMLRQNRQADGKKIVGVTAASNAGFVQDTGYYDAVVAYEDYTAMAQVPTVVVDFRGNRSFLLGLAQHFAHQLQHMAMVGVTDWGARGSHGDIAKAEVFFAPAAMKTFFEVHGPVKGMQLLNKAAVQFIDDVRHTMELVQVTDMDQLRQLYTALVQGQVNPKQGYVVKPG